MSKRWLAIDLSEHSPWRKALESENFVWMGESDRVYFDSIKGKGSARRTTDVLAFAQSRSPLDGPPGIHR